MIRAGIYNRCSTEEEAQINALAIQAEESREIVLAKGWQIAAQYIESESGTTSYKRCEYQQLMDDMETDLFDVVVIKSIDRLMRSAKDWYIFIDKLTQNNKKLYIYIDNKFYTPEDSLITGIKAILAEDFSRELSKKIKNAHKRRQEKKTGLNITVPIFGWDKVEKDVYVINEEEAEAYRYAFRLAEEGNGFYTICRIMYERGVRSKRGNRISEVQWRKMLYSPRAYGTVVMHQEEYDFEAKKMVKLPESEWIYIENALPSIVSREYQSKVLSKLKTRAIPVKTYHKNRDMKNVGHYELSGKLCCGECGANFYRVNSKSKNTHLIEWKCSKSLKFGRNSNGYQGGCNNIPIIEDAIIEQIEENCKNYYESIFRHEENLIDEVMQTIRKALTGDSCKKEEEKLKKELEKCKKKKGILLNKLMNEVISDEDFKTINDELSVQIEKLSNKVADIMVKNEEYNNIEERMIKIKQSLDSGTMDKAKTKELIYRISKITVYPNGVLEIEFDRLKLLSLLKIYNMSLVEEGLDEKYFKITIDYKHKTNIVRRKEEISNEILEYLKNNPNSFLKDLYGVLGVGKSYINECVQDLKQQGLLKYLRYGSGKGEWIVFEDINK
ncbi:MAG: recombinase family protein [Coprococcus sp.]|nr:recombinase family protein [Coprococcus sp.]